MPRPATCRTPWARTCASLALALSLSACNAAPEPDAVAPATYGAPDSVTLTSNAVDTETRIHRVYGRLPGARRKAVRRDIGRVVDRWWEAAYLGGTYPRDSFPDAFPGFTRGAAREARTDKALLTNATGGARVESVTPRRRTVTIDVMAVGGQARSVTARFLLRFSTTGDEAGVTVVRGRLFLTRRNGPWRIFGYDVAKGDRR